MIKLAKILILTTIIVFAVGMITYIYFYFRCSPPGQTSTTTEYSEVAELSKSGYTPEEELMINWKLHPSMVETQFLIKILDKEKEIFISETEVIAMTRDKGSTTQIKNPGQAGEYELWIYLVEDNDVRNLAQVLSFSVE